MGKIIRFPIRILTDMASEDQVGITPKLRDSVRPLGIATTKDVVSEAGILNSLSGDIEMITSGFNLGSGLPVFDTVTGDAIISYNSLSGMGVLSMSSTSSNVILNTSQTGTPGEGLTTILNQRTLNGGIDQETSKVGYNDFDDNNTVVAFHNVQNGDTIGKILIKCTEGFDDNSTKLSIGTNLDSEYFIKQFDAPGIGEETTNKLIEIEYGVGMYDKITYGSEIHGGKPPTPSIANYFEVLGGEDITSSTVVGLGWYEAVTTTCPANSVAEVLVYNNLPDTSHNRGVRSTTSTQDRYLSVHKAVVNAYSHYRTYVNIDSQQKFHIYSNAGYKIVGYWTDMVYVEEPATIISSSLTKQWSSVTPSFQTPITIDNEIPVMDISIIRNDTSLGYTGIRERGSRLNRLFYIEKTDGDYAGIMSILVNLIGSNPSTPSDKKIEIYQEDINFSYYCMGYFKENSIKFQEKFYQREYDTSGVYLEPWMDTPSLIDVKAVDISLSTKDKNILTLKINNRGNTCLKPSGSLKIRNAGITISSIPKTVTDSTYGSGVTGLGVTITPIGNNLQIYVLGYFK